MGLCLRLAGSSAFHSTLSGHTRTAAVEAAFKLGGTSCFGLGHLIFQHWPLQSGVLELGPFYPFDNGPNGVCTLIEPTLVSADGAVFVTNDTSRCLREELNATPTDGDAGNAYREEAPNAELRIRWAQASAVMPAMQFSILPWTMGEECERLSENALRSRDDFFWAHVEACMGGSGDGLRPVCKTDVLGKSGT